MLRDSRHIQVEGSGRGKEAVDTGRENELVRDRRDIVPGVGIDHIAEEVDIVGAEEGGSLLAGAAEVVCGSSVMEDREPDSADVEDIEDIEDVAAEEDIADAEVEGHHKAAEAGRRRHNNLDLTL